MKALPAYLVVVLLACAGCTPQTWRVPAFCPSHPEAPPRESVWMTPNLLNIDTYATITPGAVPLPNGSHVNEWNRRMAAAADADHFVIYLYEWCMGGHELSASGRAHLRMLAARLMHEPFPVVVQPSCDEALNVVRRQLVVQCLLEQGIGDADARVVLAWPVAEGLYGHEAIRLYREFQAEQRGSAVGGSAGTGSIGGLGGIGTGIGGSVGGTGY